MKKLAETKALAALQETKTAFQNLIKTNFETKARPCATCPTKGACCLDAHFVNVQITKLEAAAIRKTLAKLSAEMQKEIYRRAAEAIEKYDLKSAEDDSPKTFACPLFEKEIGCLVHSESKPAPCIAHACYENIEDLPPEELLAAVESKIERLNRRTYGDLEFLPLPVWLELMNPFLENAEARTE